MSLEGVIAQVLALPEVAMWPEMAHLFERFVSRLSIKWELPLVACRAVGGQESSAITGAAAVACMQVGLVLVDDMLDNDPRGVYVELGCAATANLAWAFQAAAFCLAEKTPVGAEWRAAVNASLAQMALTSAFGQDLDTQNLSGEENYWRVVQTKSSPFFGASLRVGALLGQSSFDIAERMHEFGVLFGEVVQVYDDLLDALESPAGPDWRQGRNNLAILYALTADHPERAQLEALSSQIDDPQALEVAQKILIRSGAISYCVYHIVQRYQAARRLLDSVSLADSQPLYELIDRQSKPLVTLLESIGCAVPLELAEV